MSKREKGKGTEIVSDTLNGSVLGGQYRIYNSKKLLQFQW